MISIQKIAGILKQTVVRAGKFIDSNAKILALIFSIIAVVISGYNSYQIKSKINESVYSPASGAVVIAPQKITEKIPKDTPFLGNSKAKVTIVEFGDYQCPYCEKFYREEFPKLKKEYIETDKVKFVFMDSAFLGQESKDAAQGAYCAKDQDKFWEYHDELYQNQQGENSGGFSSDNLKKFASNIGLNTGEFDKCLLSGKYADLIADQLKLGTSFGISGTPSFIIGKQVIRGAQPIDSFRSIIDSQL